MPANCPHCHNSLRLFNQGDNQQAECINRDCPRHKITLEFEALINLSPQAADEYRAASNASRQLSEAIEAEQAEVEAARLARWLASGRTQAAYDALFNSSHG